MKDSVPNLIWIQQESRQLATEIRITQAEKVTMKDPSISKEKGAELFSSVLPTYEKIVKNKINITLTQNQFDALVSHTYNTGGSDTLFL